MQTVTPSFGHLHALGSSTGRIGAALLLASLACGCFAAPSSTSDVPEGAAAGSTPTRTIARLQSDGTWDITSDRWGGATNASPTGGPERTPLTCGSNGCGARVDPQPCPQADFWAFDQQGYNGNMLCVYGTTSLGILDLTQVPRTTDCFTTHFQTWCITLTWDESIQSWSAGPQSGTIVSNAGEPGAQAEQFAAWAAAPMGSTIDTHSDELILYNQ